MVANEQAINVLLVEEDCDRAGSLLKYLDQIPGCKFVVTRVDNLIETLHSFSTKRYDLILVDLYPTEPEDQERPLTDNQSSSGASENEGNKYSVIGNGRCAVGLAYHLLASLPFRCQSPEDFSVMAES